MAITDLASLPAEAGPPLPITEPASSAASIDPELVGRLIAALEAFANAPAGQAVIDPELRLYTPAQAAELLGVTKNWVVERIKARTIPCTFIGRFPRFMAKHIRAIAEAGEIDPAARRSKR